MRHARKSDFFFINLIKTLTSLFIMEFFISNKLSEEFDLFYLIFIQIKNFVILNPQLTMQLLHCF